MSGEWDRSAWYVDPLDRIDTIDLDPDFEGYLSVDFSRDGAFKGLTAAAALPPVPEGSGAAVISEVVVLAGPVLTFRAQGSGVLVTFRFTGGGPVIKNDWTARLRAREG